MVYNDIIVGLGRNEVNETKNATRHAELVAIDKTRKWCLERNLDEKMVFESTTLYVTVEPCIMCAAALRYVGLRRIVFGCENERFGGCGSILQLHCDKCSSSNDAVTKDMIPGLPLQFNSGIHADVSIKLLKTFYQGENPNAPNPTDKSKRNT
ncbi:tRNA-specific adenosine deaminase 2 [Exaiptasia diaphana]|uniref:CMP/dCMP-type deaminase domain-containing protein n=1 Tax=Exaiptasia diaphana TaxID=2652724 RepID=A0A913WVL0_EXADI|nr:tRNA-specific adenosine deaminase 2 [Exaiptasia diaphana]